MSSIQRSTLDKSVDMSPEIKSNRLPNSPAPILGQAVIIKTIRYECFLGEMCLPYRDLH